VLTPIRLLFALLDGRARRGLAIMAILILATTVLEVISIGMVLPLVSALSPGGPTGTGLDSLNAALRGIGIDGSPDSILWLGLALIAAFMAKNLALLASLYWQNRIARGAEVSLSTRLLNNYLHLPYVELTQINTSGMLRTLNEAVPPVFGAFVPALIRVTSEILVVVVLMVLLFRISPAISLQALGIIGTTMAVIQLSLRRRYHAWGTAKLDLYKHRYQWQMQSLSAVKELRILAREGHFLHIYEKINRALANVLTLSHTATDIPRLALETVMVVVLVLVVVGPMSRAGQTTLILPTLAFFAAAGLRLMPSANRILGALQAMRSSLPSLERVHADLVRDTTASPSDYGPPPVVLPFARDFSLDRVSFTYPGRTAPAVDNVSLTIAAGQFVGIVGPSGAGKSTLMDILLGLVPPDRGRLLLDGYDITADPRPWQRHIGYVPQNIYLIDDTLRRNIALGVPDAEIDEIRLYAAAEKAQIADFIDQLPEKFDTKVGEHGVRISGGQRQRIGIARALYHDPSVLIFDEAASALDNETALNVQRAIEHNRRGKTIIVVSHRLNLLSSCDRLAVMSNGRLLAYGPFAELARSCSELQSLTALED
jgi:ATP-binding cassette subfamily C protein